MKLNQYIDHTILKPEATTADVARIVEEGVRAGALKWVKKPNFLARWTAPLSSYAAMLSPAF